jgi:PKD-like domain
MKNIIILLFSAFCLNNLYSQSVTISCDPSNPFCFTNVEPNTALKYKANPVGFSAAATFLWTPVGGTSTTTGQVCTVNWNNTPNTPAHSIKVTVTDTNNTTATFTQIVIVKHIGNISTVTASGGGVTQSAVGNNSTLNIPCGATTFTLSVTPPTTDPVAVVNYTWNFPWGTQTVNTPSITTTSSAGGSNTITLTAKRVDGTTTTSVFTMSIVRPTVSNISFSGTGVYPSGVFGNNDGYVVICPGAPRSVTVSGTNATSFSWTLPTGSVSASPSNSSTTTVSTSSNAGGSITASVDNACLSPKTAILYVTSITPTLGTSTINGTANSGSTFILFGTSAQIAVSTPTFGTVCTWVKNAPFNTNNIYPTYNTCQAYLAPNSYVNVTVNTSNTCGSGQSRNFSIYRPTMAMMASPNPATSTLSITMDKVVASSFLKTMNIVSDRSATVVRTFDVGNAQKSKYFEQNEKVDFDVANLPRGTYYLIATYTDGKTDKETIILR